MKTVTLDNGRGPMRCPRQLVMLSICSGICWLSDYLLEICQFGPQTTQHLRVHSAAAQPSSQTGWAGIEAKLFAFLLK